QELVFHLPGQHGVGAGGEELVGVEGGVEAVDADVGGWVQGADALGGDDAETQGGVHRDGDRDEAGAGDVLGIEGLEGEIEHGRRVAGTLQERRGPRDRQGLVSQLVASDEKNLTGLSHRLLSVPPCYGGADFNPAEEERGWPSRSLSGPTARIWWKARSRSPT